MERLMTDQEICISYKGAKSPNEQVQTLAELNGTDKNGIIRILVENKMELAWPTVRYMNKRLDLLNERIVRKEKECQELEGNKSLYRRLIKMEAEIKKDEREYREVAKMLILHLSGDRERDKAGRK